MSQVVIPLIRKSTYMDRCYAYWGLLKVTASFKRYSVEMNQACCKAERERERERERMNIIIRQLQTTYIFHETNVPLRRVRYLFS